MQHALSKSGVRRIGFLLVPNFSMIAFTSAIEPFRLANYATGRTLYTWKLFSADGAPVEGSNQVAVAVNGRTSEARDLDLVFVCGGNEIQSFNHRETIAALRRLSIHGTAIGGLCTGAFVLAKAGLLKGYRATIHWVYHSGLVSEFPDLEISDDLFEIDRNRFTCAGGTAAADLALSIVAQDHGAATASLVTDLLVHTRIRDARERQRMDLRARAGVAHPKLLLVLETMESSIEHPLSGAELSQRAGLSQRQLERLFLKYCGTTPTRHYMHIRLERARRLLCQTSMPILSVALACGFSTASHFSQAYHGHFGHAPSAERKPNRSDTTSDGAVRPSERREIVRTPV